MRERKPKTYNSTGFVCCHLFYNQIQKCKKCALHELRINKIKGKTPGAGYRNAKVVIVGMAPGFYRDKDVFCGTPFNFFNKELGYEKGIIGVKNPLLVLTNILTLKKDQFYITNVMKCSVSNDREPADEQLNECIPFLFKELRAINPVVVIGLGKFVEKVYIKFKTTFDHILNDSMWFNTYHPGYIVRTGKIEIYHKFADTINEYLELPE